MFDNLCSVAKMKGPDQDLKRRVLRDIKSNEKKAKVDLNKYKFYSEKLEAARRKNLEVIIKENKQFRKKKDVSLSRPVLKIDPDAQTAYEKWRKENLVERQCPEVCVKNLLQLVHYLNAAPGKNRMDDYEECLKRQNSMFEGFWDSPSYILRILRKCVLTRDWSNMTYFSLVLLNYDKKYIAIIRNMCKIMVKYNPLIKECGLEHQFKTLTEPAQDKLTIV